MAFRLVLVALILMYSSLTIASFTRKLENENTKTIKSLISEDELTQMGCQNGFINNVDIELCNIAPQDIGNITSLTDAYAYLCMTYWDINHRLCSEVLDSRDHSMRLPQDEKGVDEVLQALGREEMAADFCRTNHSLLTADSAVTATYDYVKKFMDFISNSAHCRKVCWDIDERLIGMCRVIVWGHVHLKEARERSKALNEQPGTASLVKKLNQIKKDLGSEKIADSQAAKAPNQAAKAPSQKEVEATRVANQNMDADRNRVVAQNSGDAVQNVVSFDGGVTGQRGEKDPSPIGIPAVTPPQMISNSSSEAVQHSPTRNTSQDDAAHVGMVDSQSQKGKETKKSDATEIKLVTGSNSGQNAKNEKPEVGREGAPAVLPNPLTEVKSPQPDEKMPAFESHEVNNDRAQLEPDSPVPIDVDEDDNDVYDDQMKPGLDMDSKDTFSAALPKKPDSPTIDLVSAGYVSSGHFVQVEDSHFFLYFMFASGVLIVGYLVFHNKNKVLGLLVEGRRTEGRRRVPRDSHAYRKLDCTLEEAVTSSAPPSHAPHIVY